MTSETGRDERFRERRRDKKQAKFEGRRERGKPTEPFAVRMLDRDNPKLTFVVGALLSFPGIYYLTALDHIHKLKPGTAATVLLVLFFSVIQQLFLELPLLGYTFAPERTTDSVERFKAWLGLRGRYVAMIVALVIGVWLITSGVIALL